MSSDPVNEMLERAKPAVGELSFGGMMGFCSGMAFRRVGRATGVILGLGFMGIQAASAAGYLIVDWEKVKVDVIKPLDASGDGKLDLDDAQIHWAKMQKILTDKVPSAGGFGAGFLLGARRG